MAAPEVTQEHFAVFDSGYWDVVRTGIDPTPIEELDPLTMAVDGVLDRIDAVLPEHEGDKDGDTPPPPAVPAPPHTKRQQVCGKMTLSGLVAADGLYARHRPTRRIIS